MTAENRDEEPLPIELDVDDESSDEPQPVPVPPPSQQQASGPVPVPPSGQQGEPKPVPPPQPQKKGEDLDEPIKLIDDGEAGEQSGSLQRKMKIGGAAARGLTHKDEFKRPLNNTGKGATRVRTFNAKIAEGPLLHMETVINDWLDSNDDIEVKHVTQTIGVMEGKRAEPNLLVMVWY
jgi:hypothetical protein